MKVVISNKTSISGLEKDEIKAIKDYLTITNPKFFKKQEMKLFHWDLPQHFKYYSTPQKDEIEVPVGMTEYILQEILVKEFGHIIDPDDIIDERVDYGNNEFFNDVKFLGELRPYQQEAVDAMNGKTVGVIESITGSGKTVIFTNFIVNAKHPTLILVNTVELANQTIEAICNFTNLDSSQIGYIGSGRYEVKPISIGIHQTITRLDDDKFDELNETFSQVISDEVHIVAAQTFYNNLSRLKAKHKYGFSATIHREDGLGEVIHFASGPLIHKVPEEDLKDHVEVPVYKSFDTDYYYFLPDTRQYQSMITDMAEDDKRNEQILRVAENYKNDKRCLFLCNRTSQVELLAEALGEKTAFLTSDVSKVNREIVMQEVKEGKKKHLVSTFSLMSTGIDVPSFNVLVFCSPISGKTRVKQSVGRVMRKSKNKNGCLIIDFIDVSVGLLVGQSKKRQRIINGLIESLS